MKRIENDRRYWWAGILLPVFFLLILAIPWPTDAQTPETRTTIPGGTINVDTTWMAANSPYDVLGSITVADGATLTIEPGVELYWNNTFHVLTINNGGALLAVGTAGSPIIFTSDNATPGSWVGLRINSGAQALLRHCEIAYGGRGNAASDAAFRTDSSLVEMSDCHIHGGGNRGIYLVGAGLAPSFTRVRVENNATNAIEQSTFDMTPAYSELIFSGNGSDAIVNPGGTVNRHITLIPPGTVDGQDIPYRFAGATAGVTIADTQVLTITPGLTLSFNNTGHTLTVNNGGRLHAVGAADAPIIFTSDAATPGSWSGIYIRSGAQAALRHCEIGYGGRSANAAGSAFRTDTSLVEMSDCHIHGGDNRGIYLVGTGLSPSFTRVQVENNATNAIEQSTFDMTPAYSDLLFSGNGSDAIVNPGGTVNRYITLVSPGTVGGQNIPYRFAGATAGVTIASAQALTITPGLTLSFNNTSHSLTVNNGGRLHAVGTVDAPIIFTSDAATPGSWSGISIGSGAQATLRHCEIGHGGRSAAVFGSGFRTNTSLVEMSDCRIHHGDKYGLYVDGAGITPSFTRVQLDNNADFAIRQTAMSARPVYDNLTVMDNGYDAAWISGGTLAPGLHWDKALNGLALHLTGITVVSEGSFLSIGPGTPLTFGSTGILDVHGLFHAIGTPTQPITLTAAPGQATFWRGIVVHGSGTMILDHCDLSLANSVAMNAQIEFRAGQGSISNCRIHSGSGDAIYARDTQPSLRNNRIEGNNFGINNVSPATVVDARTTWWGDASGPFHPTLNPTGLGNGVSDGVLFDPWLEEPGGPPAESGVFLDIFHPNRAVPGSTEHATVLVANEGETAVADAVIIAALPDYATFVDSEGEGIYWPERRLVFWKLGSLEPGQVEIFRFRVRYDWGIPFGTEDSLMAFLIGSDFVGAAFDLEEYLEYTPILETSREELSEAEVAALRQAVPDLDALISAALDEGYMLMVGDETGYSNGEMTDEIMLIMPDLSSLKWIRHVDGEISVLTIGQTTVAFEEMSGGALLDLLTGEYSFWETGEAWMVGRSPTDLGRSDCLKNCIKDKLPMSLAGELSKPLSTLSSAADCADYVATGSWRAGRDCGLSFVSKLPPGSGSLMTLRDCLKDHQNDPNSCRCKKDKVECVKLAGLANAIQSKTTTCNLETGLYGSISLMNCGNQRYAKCVPGVGCTECYGDDQFTNMNFFASLGNPTWASAMQTIWLSLNEQFSPSAICALMNGSGGQSCKPITYSPARDPNAKYGVEGDLLPGQTVTYTITYENVGEGEAYGVYIRDELSDVFDLDTLTIYGPGQLIAPIRTIFWTIGTLGPAGTPEATGAISFTVQLKPDLPSGTKVINQAVVYFPSVPEVTPTDLVVNTIQPLIGVPQRLEVEAGQSIAITLAGADVANAPLTYQVVDGPIYGQLSGTAPNLTYQAPGNYVGPDWFTFRVSNGITTTEPVEVTIMVLPSSDDTSPPQVAWTAPAANQVITNLNPTPVFSDTLGYLYGPTLVVAFNEQIAFDSIVDGILTLQDNSGNAIQTYVYPVPGFPNQLRAVLRSPLVEGRTYTATLQPGIADLTGNVRSQSFAWTFHTTQMEIWHLYLPLIQR